MNTKDYINCELHTKVGTYFEKTELDVVCDKLLAHAMNSRSTGITKLLIIFTLEYTVP